MRKTLPLILILSVMGCMRFSALARGQEVQKTEQQETIISPQQATASVPPRASYDPGGRRDPFKDLIGGGRVSGKASSTEGQLTIDNAVLVGIVKTPKSFVAVLSGPQQFPYFLKIGDKLADGYVFSINGSQVIFRKTHERGFPLMRPRNVVKEINPEER
jgi:Tfp pilus assembly protein PilP